MAHVGSTINKWLMHFEDRQERIHFAADMLRQVIPSLKTLHSLGYAHGDIKPDNICVRVEKDGTYKFTLIDFGVCRKLPQDGQLDEVKPNFVGNYLFASKR
jgi:serine/threonine protein kinase